MRGLMAAIVIMGVLIVLGMIALGYGIYLKVNKRAPAAAAAQASNEIVIPLPAQSYIKDILQDEHRIIVHAVSGDKTDRLIILKSSTGEHAGTVVLKPE